jgi:hypothetical protein
MGIDLESIGEINWEDCVGGAWVWEFRPCLVTTPIPNDHLTKRPFCHLHRPFALTAVLQAKHTNPISVPQAKHANPISVPSLCSQYPFLFSIPVLALLALALLAQALALTAPDSSAPAFSGSSGHSPHSSPLSIW